MKTENNFLIKNYAMDAAVASNLMLKINVWQLIITSKGFSY